MIAFLAPDRPLYWLIAGYALVALCYIRGLYLRGERRDLLPAVLFIAGLIGLYLLTQTALDRWGRELFYAHRVQHLFLHHLAPFLIALAAPSDVLLAGIPSAWQRASKRIPVPPILRLGYRWLQDPLIGAVLFVGMIAFWLTPAIHMLAMQSLTGYWLMNLGMAADGLAFWWFMLDRRPPGASATTYSVGKRIVVLWAIMPPQIAIGAYITLTSQTLYPHYATAEALTGISAMTDQQLGGLITWIPAAMMSVVGTLILLSFSFRHAKTDIRPQIDANAASG